MTGNIGNKKSGNFIKLDKISALVSPSGEVSNLLLDDFDIIVSFMSSLYNERESNLI